MALVSEVVVPVESVDPSSMAQDEFTYIDIGAIDSAAGRVAKPKRIAVSDAPSRARQAVRQGDVLFSTVRPYLRAIALTPPLTAAVASTAFCVLRAATGIDPRFLCYWVRSEAFIAQVLPLQRGSSYPAVRDQDVLDRSIPVPPSAQQRVIADRLDELFSELDTAVAELQSAQAKLIQYRQSLLKAAVQGDLTAEWRAENPPQETGAELLVRILSERRAHWEARQLERHATQGKSPPKDWQASYLEPAAANETCLPRLPLGWTWTTIDQLSPDDLANGRSVPTSDSGAKVLRLTAVRKGGIDLSEYKHGAWTVEEAAPFCVQHNDLLVVRGNGSLSLVGRAGLVPAVGEPVAFPDTLIRLRTLAAVVRPAWLAALWDSARTRDHLEGRARTSAGIYKISQPDILSLTVAVPPLDEQDAALVVLFAETEQLNALSLAIEQGLKMAAAQRQNILRAAFTGQLVPQDPNDEPASALLVRIHAERRQATDKPTCRAPRRAKAATA